MGRRGFKRLPLLIGLCALIGGGGVFAYWWAFLSLTPEGVLRKMQAVYSSARTFEEKTSFTIASKMGDMEAKMKGTTRLVFERPNKVRHVTTMEVPLVGKSKETVVCDGKHVYREISILKQVLKTEAPANIAEVLGGKTERLISEISLLAGADPLAQVEKATLKKGEKIGNARTVLLEIRLRRGGTQRIWVDRRNFLIRKSETSLAQSSAGLSISTTLVEVVESVKVNHPVSPEQFAYTPPEGFKVVSRFELPKPGAKKETRWSGKEAPDFELSSLDGKKVRLGDLRGRVVLLDFWATWCPPCRKELPHIEKLHKEFSKKGLVVLGINDEPPEVAKKFLRDRKLTFTTLHDKGGKVHRLYKVEAIPTTVIIDRNGRIVERFVGYTEEKKLREALRKANLR